MRPNYENRNAYGKWRIARGMSLKEVAEMLNVTIMSVSLFERGLMTSSKIKANYDSLIIKEVTKNE